MKKYLKQFLLLTLGLFLFQSCEESDLLVDEVFDTVTRGATLKTIDPINTTFDFNDPSVEWQMQVEFRDHNDGDNLSEVKMYVTHVGANGSTPEAFLKTVPKSEFNIDGPHVFPQTVLKTNLTDVLDALGLQEGDYEATDQFVIRLESVLTDGRVFTNRTNGNVAGGSFFESPYQYSVQFFCFLTDVDPLFNGKFIVVVDTWADYAPGDEVPVIPDANDPLSFRILASNNPYINNPNTAYMLCKVNPEDGTITVTSNEPFDYGVDIPVTGSGVLGTCTGDISINPLTFGAYGDWVFQLVKK